MWSRQVGFDRFELDMNIDGMLRFTSFQVIWFVLKRKEGSDKRPQDGNADGNNAYARLDDTCDDDRSGVPCVEDKKVSEVSERRESFSQVKSLLKYALRKSGIRII